VPPAPEFTLRIQPHDRTVAMSGDRPVLDAALSAGFNLPHSCKSGHCGSCRALLVSGSIQYPAGRPLGLADSEVASGYVLLCKAHPTSNLIVQARFIANVAEVDIKTLPCRIARLERPAPDVLQVFLKLPSVETLPFQAGQYLDVMLENGRRRSFSIACPPHDSDLLELHVRRAPGGAFTSRLFAELDVGSLLRIEGPFGQFVYHENASPVLMIAGGTGFAPLKAMLRQELERAADGTREIHFYWGARTATDLYEESQLLAWVGQHPRLKFTAVLSDEGAADASHRRVGWVHEAVLADYPTLETFDIYAAGPPAMIEAIRASFPDRGASLERLRFDSFDYAPDTIRS